MFYLPKENLALAKAEPDLAVQNWPDFFARQHKQAQHPLLKRYYQSKVPQPNTPIGDVELLAMDMETTGLNAKVDGIVSTAVVPFTLARIQVSQARQWLLKPRYQLTEDSIKIHRVTHSEVEHAQDITEILPELLALLAGRVAVVHYRAIERPFLHETLLDRLGEGVHFPLLDTMAIEAQFHRKKMSWLQRLRGSRPEVSIRLADSRRRYHLPDYRPHHAATDAIACAELLQAQIAHHYSSRLPIGKLLL